MIREGGGSLLCELERGRLERPRVEDAAAALLEDAAAAALLEDAAAALEDAAPLEDTALLPGSADLVDALFGFSLTTSIVVFSIGLGISTDAARF